MNASSTDRIEKQVLVRASHENVWHTLTDSEAFGNWFGAKLDGEFATGARVRGPLTIEGMEHLTLDITIEKMEPKHLFSWRWHPGAMDPDFNYSTKPSPLVVFELEDAVDGTMLTVVETGFDKKPFERRMEVFDRNTNGWEAQITRISEYVCPTL